MGRTFFVIVSGKSSLFRGMNMLYICICNYYCICVCFCICIYIYGGGITMERKKRGFVLYFDNCEQIMRLPVEEMAPLVRVVMKYAMRLADEKEEQQWLAEQYRALTPAAGMALGFTVENLRRDHQGYLATTTRRAAQRRESGGKNCVSNAEMGKYTAQLRQKREQQQPTMGWETDGGHL